MAESSPFETLGLAARFDLEPGEIRRAYLERVASAHPDAGAGGEADRCSAVLNRARATLEDPERRAGVLLAALGGPSKEEDRSLPDGFLMEVMELRERVEGTLAGGDAEAREACVAEAEARRAAYIDEVGSLFASLGADPAASELAGIRTTLNAWRYIERLIEQLDPEYDPSRDDFAS